MASAGTAYITIAGDWAPFSKEIAALPTSKVGRAMTTAGKKLTRNLTLPLVGIGVAAGKMSMDFNRSMGEVATQAGGSRKEVKKLGDQILKLTAKGRFAQGPQELTKALYDIESVGFRGAKAMKTLKAASDFATVGNADLESTTSALVGTLKTGIKGAGNMKQAIGTLNATIGAGKMHMEDLNAAIGTGFLGSAKGLGISLSGVGAALAELTSQGVPASSAATRLRMTMSLMANPTDKAKAALKSIGIGSEDIAKKMRSSGGLVTALELLQTKMQGLSKIQQNQLLTAAFGGAKSGGTIVQLLGNLGDLSKKQQEVIKNAGNINKAIQETNAEPAVKMQKAWSKIQSTLITLGDVLVPAVTPVIEELAGDVSDIAKDFEKLSPSTQGWIVKIGIAVAALGPLLSIGGNLLLVYGRVGKALGKAAEAFGLMNTAQALGVSGAATGAAARATVAGDSTYALARSFGRGRIASSIAQSGEFAMAGAAGARTLAASLARTLGPAVAAVGIGNIVTSILSKDWRDVGFEAGGAIAGGIAGFMLGGPAGAMIGVGVGSIGGELLGSLFDSEKKLTPLQIQMATSAHRVSEALQRQRLSGEALKGAQGALREENGRVRNSLHSLFKAELHLQEVRSHHKQGTIAVLRAEAEVASKHERAARATDKQRRAEEQLRFAREAQGRSISEVVHSSAVGIAAEERHTHKLQRRIEIEGRTPELNDRMLQATKRLAGYEKDRTEALHVARGINKQWAQSLEDMTVAQHRFGARGRGLVRSIEAQKQIIHELREGVQKGGGPYAQMGLDRAERKLANMEGALQKLVSSGSRSFQRFAAAGGANTQKLSGSFQALSGSAGESISEIMANTSGALKAFGAANIPKFALKHPGFAYSTKQTPNQAKQQGGFIVPGNRTGDHFKTALPPDSFILNRNATEAFGFARGGLMPVALESKERAFLPHEVKAMGGPRTLEAMNQAVPRFQKGGGLGPEPQLLGPSGALRSLGQAAIHQVYQGAKHYLAKHRPAIGGSVKDHPELQPGISAIIATVLKRFPGLAITSTTGGEHAENSLHPEGRAADLTAGSGYMLKAAAWIHSKLGPMLTEGIHNPNLSVKYGKDVAPGFWGAATWADHLDHIHLGKQRGGLVGKAIQRLAGGGGVPGWVHGSSTLSPDQLATLAHYVGAKSPGLMSQIAGAESGGNPRLMGSAGDKGLWQIIPSTASAFGINYGQLFDPLANAQGMNKIAFTGGGGSPPQGLTAWSTYNSGVYSSEPKGHVLGSLAEAGGAGSDEHSFKEDVPAVYHGCRTGSLDFPSIPKSLSGVNRELKRWEAEIVKYRRTVKHAQKANKPGIAQALEHNVTAISAQLNKLRIARHKLRFEQAKKKITKRLARKLGKVAGYETTIEGLERSYGIASQTAEQIVGLEPIQPELPASATDAQREAAEKDYVTRFTDYVNTKERPAYGSVLEKVADWRNAILRAEYFGFDKDRPSVSRMESTSEKKVYEIVSEIEAINQYVERVKADIAVWRANHPKAKELPDGLKKEIAERDKKQAKLPLLRFEDRELRAKIGELRSFFFPGGEGGRISPPVPPLPGSGSLEDHLTEVQGIHWPDQHSLMDLLPADRVAGMFGGAIWDTQTAISELGLKVNQAASSLGGGGGSEGGADNSERNQLLEQLLREANQRNILRGIEERVAAGMPKVGSGLQLGGLIKVMPPYAGKAHGGAIVPGPPTQEKTMVVKGREGIFTEEQMAAMGGDGGSIGDVKVHVHGDIVSSHPDPVEVLINDRRFPAEVRKITDHDSRREARGAGRGLARAGVFSR